MTGEREMHLAKPLVLVVTNFNLVQSICTNFNLRDKRTRQYLKLAEHNIS